MDNSSISQYNGTRLVLKLMLAISVILSWACQPGNGSLHQSDEIRVSVANPSERARNNYLVQIPVSALKEGAHHLEPGQLVVFSGDKEVPSQATDESLMFLVDQMKAGENINFVLKQGNSGLNQVKRTQAELSVKTGGYFENRKYIGGDFKNIQYLRVPDEHTDHSYYIRYEGPGWESDLVGYRFYLDWRNATDVFGKKTHAMVLQQVGLDGFDSYHEPQDWGMDVLKVGKSLGIGSLAMYDGEKAVRVDQTDSVICRIAENGNLYSAIQTQYFGWKVNGGTYDVSSHLSIHAGTRLTHHRVSISNQPDNLCTGIGKDDKAKLYMEQGDDHNYGYLATYGLQSLNNDHLGLAVFFANKDYKGFTEDEFSHIVKLNVVGGTVDYYFLAAWEGETEGIKDEEGFLTYVKKTARELATPLTIEIKQ